MAKAKVLSIAKTAYWEAAGMDADKFSRLSSAAKFFQEKPLTFKQTIQALAKFGISVPSEITSFYDLMEYLSEEGISKGDNTYNWSYWGPTVDFSIVQKEGADIYDAGLIIARMHLGGDVRGNYTDPKAFYFESVGEEAPFYNWSLIVELSTDKGEVRLTNEDFEAYYFIVDADETNTLTEGDSYGADKINEAFDWQVAFW